MATLCTPLPRVLHHSAAAECPLATVPMHAALRGAVKLGAVKLGEVAAIEVAAVAHPAFATSVPTVPRGGAGSGLPARPYQTLSGSATDHRFTELTRFDESPRTRLCETI